MHTPPPDSFHPADRKAWRKWLEKNHATSVSLWVIFTKKTKEGVRGLSWSDAVDEALCFGWIDSRARPLDEERYMQFFSRRKPKSVWSRINKDKIERLIADGLMAEAGFRSIEIAKANGSWSSLDHVEDMIIPKDLEKAFRKVKGSKAYFESMGKSIRKPILQWIAMAKLPETRQRRITEVVESAGKGERPKAFRSS
jgi:uncharacterized protein YdeI (YjbR/CyaY-like superfamily)